MTEENNNKTNENNNKYTPTVENEWLIRPCCVYEDEYSDCTSIKARFNQYFIHGQTIDCSQWKRDADNCLKWQEKQDKKAALELIESEKIRRKQRLIPHYANNVWERRKTPPKDWNKPLPDYLIKEYENSYLHIKSKELKGEIPPTIDGIDRCVIV